MTALRSEVVDQLAGAIVDLDLVKVQVRLSEVDFKSEPPNGLVIDDVVASIGVAVKWQVTAGGQHGRVLLSVRYTLRALLLEEVETAAQDQESAGAEDDDESACGWEASVQFQAQWILGDPGEPADEQLRAFAARVGLMTIHPYARAKIQALVAESGWGIFTMDVLTNVDGIFESADEPGLLDLEGIAVERSEPGVRA